MQKPVFAGATVRSRTADILITSEVLYQLSYGGSKGGTQHDMTDLDRDWETFDRAVQPTKFSTEYNNFFPLCP